MQGQSDTKQKGRLLLCGGSRYRYLAWLWRSAVLLVIRCESLSFSHPLPLFQPATDSDFFLFYKLHPGFIIQAVSSGSHSEQQHFSRICMESYGDWTSDGTDFYLFIFVFPSLAVLVVDTSVALTPRVDQKQGCLWSKKLHIRALFNISYMARSHELLWFQVKEQLAM